MINVKLKSDQDHSENATMSLYHSANSKIPGTAVSVSIVPEIPSEILKAGHDAVVTYLEELFAPLAETMDITLEVGNIVE